MSTGVAPGSLPALVLIGAAVAVEVVSGVFAVVILVRRAIRQMRQKR